MKTFIVLVLSTFSTFSETTKILPYPSKDETLSGVDSMDGRIINGYLNKPGEIPYIVSLGNCSVKHNCGGVIIDHEWILTAAHCLTNVSVVSISYGTINWEAPLIRHYVGKENFFVHEGYLNNNRFIYDIALIKTPYVGFNDSIKIVSLPNGTDESYANQWARASGWGRSYAENHTNLLRSIDVQVASNTYCQKQWSKMDIVDTHICAGLHSNKGVCDGDSGGPLVLNANEIMNETPLLIGLTSFGNPCCRLENPNVYTRVSEYIKWIEDTKKSVNRILNVPNIQ